MISKSVTQVGLNASPELDINKGKGIQEQFQFATQQLEDEN